VEAKPSGAGAAAAAGGDVTRESIDEARARSAPFPPFETPTPEPYSEHALPDPEAVEARPVPRRSAAEAALLPHATPPLVHAPLKEGTEVDLSAPLRPGGPPPIASPMEPPSKEASRPQPVGTRSGDADALADRAGYSGGEAMAARDLASTLAGAVEKVSSLFGIGEAAFDAAAAAPDAPTREQVAELTAAAGGPGVVGGTSSGPASLPTAAEKAAGQEARAPSESAGLAAEADRSATPGARALPLLGAAAAGRCAARFAACRTPMIQQKTMGTLLSTALRCAALRCTQACRPLRRRRRC